MNKKFKKVLCTILAVVMLTGVLTTFANAAVTSFTDVPEGAWFYDAVMSCASNGYVSGMGDNKFEPNGKLTYAQIMTMYTNAFYKEAKRNYENNRYLEMDAYFNDNPSWYGYNAYFFKDNGLLEGTSANIRSASNMSSPISRYEVVQIAYNILNDHSLSITDDNKLSTHAFIADWSGIPAQYQDAVSTCFFTGVIKGHSDGSFGGDDTLTRAQGCVILNNLVGRVGGRTGGGLGSGHIDDAEPPATPEKPAVDENLPKLPNGKPATEENVLAILDELKNEYPTGTPWGARTVPGTNYYKGGAGPVVKNLLEGNYGLSATYACGGWAAFVSDRIFGRDGFPARRVTDPMAIRPGDIIVRLNNGKVTHASVAITHATEINGIKGYVHSTDGNPIVEWSDITHGNPGSEALCKLLNPNVTWEVWTRYPD